MQGQALLQAEAAAAAAGAAREKVGAAHALLRLRAEESSVGGAADLRARGEEGGRNPLALVQKELASSPPSRREGLLLLRDPLTRRCTRAPLQSSVSSGEQRTLCPLAARRQRLDASKSPNRWPSSEGSRR